MQYHRQYLISVDHFRAWYVPATEYLRLVPKISFYDIMVNGESLRHCPAWPSQSRPQECLDQVSRFGRLNQLLLLEKKLERKAGLFGGRVGKYSGDFILLIILIICPCLIIYIRTVVARIRCYRNGAVTWWPTYCPHRPSRWVSLSSTL